MLNNYLDILKKTLFTVEKRPNIFSIVIFSTIKKQLEEL